MLTELEFVEERLTTLLIGFNDQKLGRKEYLLKEVLISVSQEKNIVCTSIPGRDGTIKEYISDGDYSLTLQIGISNFDFENSHNIEYPIKEMEKFTAFLKTKEPIELHSDFLLMFNIMSGVIKGYQIQQETHSNRQSVTVQMISDDPYEIKLSKD